MESTARMLLTLFLIGSIALILPSMPFASAQEDDHHQTCHNYCSGEGMHDGDGSSSKKVDTPRPVTSPWNAQLGMWRIWAWG